MSSWPRLVIGTILLFIGAGYGYLGWAVETCMSGQANALLTSGVVALVANVLAWLMLGRRVPSKLVLFVAALPAVAALIYSSSTLQLAFGYLIQGQGACALISADEGAGVDGRETLFIFVWLLVCASFWGGLIPVLRRAITVWKESRA
ncbi:MAG TPA: hypothetical protein VFZ35_07095 [Sphingomicrobium sp.]